MKRTLISALALAAATSAHAQDAALPQASSPWFTDGQAAVAAMIARQPNTARARNVIVLVADGNGVGTNYITRLFDGQQKGMLGEENVLPYETPEWSSALIKTYNINAQTPDSAPTAGAMNTGVKQRFNLINLGGDAIHDDCATVTGNELTTFAEIVSDMGKSVGAVSTARLTHATPAAVYAKTANRNWEGSVPEGCDSQTDIATQLIDSMEAGIIDFAMGGGGRAFLPEGEANGQSTGRRTDGVNLIDRATGLGVQFANDTASFDALTMDAPVLALFNDSHMEYEADRADDDEPSLAEMTRKAIEFLSQNENGYYLEIEAGRVDHANHDGNAARVVRDGVAFAEAVAMADELTDESDTLIIVTADHEHSIAMNGYCGRGSDIMGLCYDVAQSGDKHSDELVLGSDGKPFTVVGYLNGAGSVLVEQPDGSFAAPEGRADITQEEATDLDYVQQALVPKSSESHSGEDVAVYAKGPWAHLFDSTLEQNVIFHVMNHAITAE
ncbi:alkaline phosphatase [Salipiger aestuarii]|uniref:Alkaline phosphatase n=1 Tax=Salipiger aestuarii TaxID=568098 RepID=A0A327YIC4_9RHOB|nr:alkaline phosphatase [Salipiger aestuarii]EIE50486.1 alkaline phosphatase [Citreicella sp. 357]KAA8609254.1 alkaline phosphatase [Salipiger aestuarii]KAA8615209.1 alkaline phosphatase [Salipiger aestuarii]KAB2542865.1 alkaline phosphatase [Salipiger aestuarii]RAK20780.1 alkaline phosphatase [Salipiger aestuarii]